MSNKCNPISNEIALRYGNGERVGDCYSGIGTRASMCSRIDEDGTLILSFLKNLKAPPSIIRSWSSSDKYLCHWEGVSCHGDHTMSALDLTEKLISGTLSPTIGGLRKLRVLHLNSNNLFVAIPLELGNCTKIEFLDLSDNSLHGRIPLEVGQLKKLLCHSFLTFSPESFHPPFLGLLSWRRFTCTKTTWLEKFHQMLEISPHSPAYG